MLGPRGKSASLILMVAVGFILLMVCVNLANLLLARGEHRAREPAIRTALGAGGGRVVRQLVTEGLVLGSIEGALGLLLASWGYRGVVGPPSWLSGFRPGGPRRWAPWRLSPASEVKRRGGDSSPLSDYLTGI